jgi:hypothetical protein
VRLIAEAGGGASFGFGRFLFAILRWRGCLQRPQQFCLTRGYFFDRQLKSGFIGFGGFVEAGDFPHKLQRSCLHLFRRYGRLKIEQIFYVPAHVSTPRQRKGAPFWLPDCRPACPILAAGRARLLRC